jgi:hypothetical protein
VSSNNPQKKALGGEREAVRAVRPRGLDKVTAGLQGAKDYALRKMSISNQWHHYGLPLSMIIMPSYSLQLRQVDSHIFHEVHRMLIEIFDSKKQNIYTFF